MKRNAAEICIKDAITEKIIAFFNCPLFKKPKTSKDIETAIPILNKQKVCKKKV